MEWFRLQGTRPAWPMRPQQKRPSVFVAFVDEVFEPKTCELVPFAQLPNSIDGMANGFSARAVRCVKRLPG